MVVDKCTKKRIEGEKRKEAASKYWIRCPSCGKRVAKKELIKKRAAMYVAGRGQNIRLKLRLSNLVK